MWRIDRLLFLKSVGIRVEGFNGYTNEDFGWSFGHLGQSALEGSSYVVPETATVECSIQVLNFLRRAIDRKHENAEKTARELMRLAFTEDHVRLWMRHNQEPGDEDLTGLVERCAEFFEQNEEGGPLDQPDHWIWFTPSV